jgi:hypothetical protein
VPVSAGQAELDRSTADGLQALIDVALEISNLKEFLGREKPTVITVRVFMLCLGAQSDMLLHRCYSKLLLSVPCVQVEDEYIDQQHEIEMEIMSRYHRGVMNSICAHIQFLGPSRITVILVRELPA